MSNSLWRVIGLECKGGSPYSNSDHESEGDARYFAEGLARGGRIILAIMPQDESVMVAASTLQGKEHKLMQNMEKVLHEHPEWFYDDQSEDRYVEWKRQNFPSSQVFSTPGPRKPKPQLPPEVWRVKPEVDKTDYMAAVRAMCGNPDKGKGE